MEGCCAKFKVVLKKLVECQTFNIRNCDALVLEYSEFLDLAIKVETSAFEEYNFTVDRLDVFLLKHIGSVSSLSKLWDLDSFPWSRNCRERFFSKSASHDREYVRTNFHCTANNS